MIRVKTTVTTRRNNQTIRVVSPSLRRGPKKRQDTDYLKSVSDDRRIVIGPTDGKRTIVQSVDLFSGGIEEDLHDLDTDVEGQPTGATAVQIFEMTKSGTLARMFGSFQEDLDRLCLTQDQIISFVENNVEWFRTGSYTISFLFIARERHCVARVTWISGEFYVCIKNIANRSIWPSASKVRFVIPKPKQHTVS